MAAPGSPIVIDGSHGEGGGALVRTCLVMSSLTQQPVRIDGVRSGTKYAGLDYEDLVLMQALAKSSAAEMTGAAVGSTTVSFLPTRRARGLSGNLDLPEDDGRRGASVPVVLGALLPVLARTGVYSQVSLSGETYGNRSLSFDYFQNVTVAASRKMGVYGFPDQELAGFGRESRGRITMDVEPSAFQALDWSVRGKLIGCRALVTTAELPTSVAQRGVAHLETMAEHARVPLEVESNPVDSHTPGAFITVWAVCERGMGGATAMGDRGLRVETLAHSAFEGMLDWLATDATVDPFLADQLLVTACLAEGETTFRTSRLTQRLLTSIWVIKQFLPIHITVRGSEDHAGVIAIKR
jgi:RNA 3'-terminal phosphate cyclase (ATP)